MKTILSTMILSLVVIQGASAQTSTPVKPTAERLYIDVHYLTPGSVKFADVLAAHQKDLATEGKYDVHFKKFWVDESKGAVYCLSSAPDTASIIATHREAHGLLPQEVFAVTDDKIAVPNDGGQYFLDVHNLGAGNVTAAAVAAAHEKDLKVEKKYGVNFINYWVDEKKGLVMCLSQAPDSSAIVKTHKEAHGLLPDEVLQVKQGQ